MADLKGLSLRAVQSLAIDSPEFSRLMRAMIDRIAVLPYRLFDSEALVLRAHFKLGLASQLAPSLRTPSVVSATEAELVVDLFEPPQRVRHRSEIIGMRAQGISEGEVACRLGITRTAAQRAAKLHRQMQELGIDDPYRPILEPPPDCPKLRRHRHPRYRFEPLEGFGQG
jgi:hypothetical protein